MKPTDSISEAVGEVYGYSKAYFQQQLEYFKLDMAERVSRSLSLGITIFVLAQLFLMIMLFASLALGIYLGERFGSYTQAFLVISGGYAVLTLFMLIFRRLIITNPILSRIIKVFFQND
ncbi:MAG: phage holin family protein [Phaeodactylibacter sp.]|uniref:phage holin family protein n=1 Tax=Phaeodactylibacter sp. TaxID=1940289 RepID=UPI0032EBDF2D